MNMQAAALAYRHARSCSSAVSEDFSHRGTITSRIPHGPGFRHSAGVRMSSALPVFCPAFAPDRLLCRSLWPFELVSADLRQVEYGGRVGRVSGRAHMRDMQNPHLDGMHPGLSGDLRGPREPLPATSSRN
jgi:hypothetical protein